MSLFSDWGFIENFIFSVSLNELSLIPEFFLAFTAVTIITHCSLIAYNKKYNNVLLQFSVTSLCMLIIFLTLLLYLHEGSITLKHLSFEFSFLSDSLGFLSKIITIIASLFCMYLLQDYIIEYKINSVEYDLLMLYAILGLTMLITANDFGTIFLALELQSLSLYMLSGFKKNSIYSIESGLKYFILGALSAAYFLLGWSLLYGISGLFVLTGFHFFFFNIFSDVNSKIENNATQYKTNNENLSDNNEYELPETSLMSENNLFFDTNNDFDELGIVLSFNSNLKVMLKLAEFLCCDCCNNMQSALSKNEPLSIEDEILKLYDSRQSKINNEEYQYIYCDFCRNFIESFKIIDENQIYANANNKENLKLEIEKKLYENKQVMQPQHRYNNNRCWFCETLLENYNKAVEEEERKIKIRTKKMINIYEEGLSTEAFVRHYSFLETYFSKRNELTLNKLNKDLLIKGLFQTCITAADLENHNVPVCKNIIKRFNKAWEIEGLRSFILPNKIKKTCEKLKNSGKTDKICEAIKRLSLFVNDVDNSTTTYSSSLRTTTNPIISSFKNKGFLEKFFNDTEVNLQEKIKKTGTDSAFYNGVSKELKRYWKHIYYYKQLANFTNLEKKNLFILNKDTNSQIYISYNSLSFARVNSLENTEVIKKTYNITKTEKSAQNQEKTNLNSKKKEIEIKTKKISYNKKSTNKTNEYKLTESSLTLILISFFFKLAVAPFHLWSLDIYEGSLTSSTVFFAVVTKFSVIVILIKICYYGFYSLLKSSLYQSIIIASASSIFVGSVAGLTERKLKSLLAYSSINNIGYILLALTIGTLNGIKTTVFYLIIYISSSLATWSGLISIQLQTNRYIKKQNKEFGDIAMLRKTNPILTITLQIALFSTAGLPPFIGFLTKMNVFINSIESHIFLVSLITILLSIISTFYYLRLVKIMCFEKLLVGKLYKPIKIKQSTVNTIFSFFLPYQFFKPWLSIFFSYKVVIC